MNIQHEIGVEARYKDVLRALTTIDGLEKWWTMEVTGDPREGKELTFHFGEESTTVMKVLKSNEKEILWECHKGPEEWVGTEVHFLLEEQDGEVIIFFTHQRWAEETRFFSFCSTKWATFLLSLKDYLETGEGRPFPLDLHITHSKAS